MLSKIKVEYFSKAQLISFCNEICSDYDQPLEFKTVDDIREHYRYQCSKKDNKGNYPLPELERVINYILKHNPGGHYFDGDEYVPSLGMATLLLRQIKYSKTDANAKETSTD